MSNSKNDSKNVSKENNEKKYKIEDFAYTFGDFESINKVSAKMIINNYI